MEKPEPHHETYMVALAALLVDQLPDAIAVARAKAATDRGPLSPPRFLKAWRDELVRKDKAAISPARLVAAIPILFAVCEVGIEVREGRPGIHLRGLPTSALDTTLRLMHIHDSARRTAVGEALMAMLLADLALAWFDVNEHGPGTMH
jgi:hypothetical protein